MAPHLLSLPLEIRVRILEYALVEPEEFFVCETGSSRLCGFKTVPVPRIKMPLKLLCKQVLLEMNALTAPKLELRTCHLGCSARWVTLHGHAYGSIVSGVRRRYTAFDVRARTNLSYEREKLSRYIDSILGQLIERPGQCRWKRYEICGEMRDPEGVDVVLFL